MPQLTPAIIKERAAQLRAAVAEQHSGWLASQIGTLHSLLVEKSGRNGHAENFAMVELDGHIEPGTIIAARITGAQGKSLQGTVEL